MKICYSLSYPLFMDKGGGVTHCRELVRVLESHGFKVTPLDWYSETVDFQVLILFGFTHFNPEVLRYLKSRDVRIITVPIFDRTRSLLSYRILSSVFKNLPVQNLIKTKYEVLKLSDIVVASSKVEKEEIVSIFGIDKNKVMISYLGLPSDIFQLDKRISEEMFYKEFGLRDFVFYPSAGISRRKNQISLIKALEGTGIKVVLTGCDNVEKRIEDEFLEVVRSNKDVVCLPRLSREMLISAYKNSKVLAFVSLAETAGIVAIEGGYFGNNLVLSRLRVFQEYYGNFALYVKSKSCGDIRKKVIKAMEMERSYSMRSYILENLTWERYAKPIIDWIHREV
ncbi:MAG: glycosyltransferase [Brevinematia bacterium]